MEERQALTAKGWWRVLSTLLPAVGFVLSRNLLDDAVPLVGVCLACLLTYLFAYGLTPQLGVALHMRGFGAREQTPRS
jgi:hypothetical protein